MKKVLAVLTFVSLILVSCSPSDASIQAAIAKTQTAETAFDNAVQTAISQTQAALPSFTPSPVNTKVPTPAKPQVTATSKPTAIYYPPTATARRQPTLEPTVSRPVLDITIKVINQCPEQHTVIFTGPVRLKYVVDPGKTVEWQAAKGTYSWTVDGVVSEHSPQDLYVAVWNLTLCP